MLKKLREKGEVLLLFLLFFTVYILLQTKSIYGGDSGDLVTAAWVWGVPHPPGYPLYTLLGAIISHALPFFTPAWRVGLLSSISSALTLVVFYKLCKKICQKTWPSLLSTFTLAFIYPFWLYSEVAEVFALNNLFAVSLTYLFYRLFVIANFSSRLFKKKRRMNSAITKLLLIFSLILGLSLAHHHIIVLLFPAFAYIFFKNKKFKNNILKIIKSKKIVPIIIAFFMGFSFYLYPFFASQKEPIISWDRPKNLKNLIRLFTRADYGTFRSSTNLGDKPILRLYSTLSFFKLLLDDFKILGIILMIFGFFWLYKKNKTYFHFSIIFILTCLFFIFYSSYILINDFMVATFERFAILPYVFLSPLLGFGALFLCQQLKKTIKKTNFSPHSQKIFKSGLIICFFIIPLSIFLSNFKKISILKNDFTAENMAKDFLDSLPENSILIPFSDTTVFNLQYVRYALGYRKDIALLNKTMVADTFYYPLYQKNFPSLTFESNEEQDKLFTAFINNNSQKNNIFIEQHYHFEPGKDWIPYGLSWQYLGTTTKPNITDVAQKNQQLWNNFHNPLSESLSQFKNLFLADVLRVYSDTAVKSASYFIQQDNLEIAKQLLNTAKKYNDQEPDVYLGLGAIALKKEQCRKAEKYFQKTLELDPENAHALGYLRKTALDCFDDQEAAKRYQDQCISVKEKQHQPLQELE